MGEVSRQDLELAAAVTASRGRATRWGLGRRKEQIQRPRNEKRDQGHGHVAPARPRLQELVIYRASCAEISQAET